MVSRISSCYQLPKMRYLNYAVTQRFVRTDLTCLVATTPLKKSIETGRGGKITI